MKNLFTFLLITLSFNFSKAQSSDGIQTRLETSERYSKSLLRQINKFAENVDERYTYADSIEGTSKAVERLLIENHGHTKLYERELMNQNSTENYQELKSDINSLKDAIYQAYEAAQSMNTYAKSTQTIIKNRDSVSFYYEKIVSSHKELSIKIREAKQALFEIVKQQYIIDYQKRVKNNVTKTEKEQNYSDTLVFEYTEYKSFAYELYRDIRIWNENASPKWQLISGVKKDDDKKELTFTIEKSGKYSVNVTYFDSDWGQTMSNRKEFIIEPFEGIKTVIIRFKSK